MYDKEGNTFKFPALILQERRNIFGKPSYVRIWTKAGKNDNNNLYWGRKTINVWNKSDEVAYLEDSSGESIHTYPDK